jgi:hypothetical protein
VRETERERERERVSLKPWKKYGALMFDEKCLYSAIEGDKE